jgi:3-(3-hydroxy-phenyl)propionate hydroxylase
MGGVLVAIDDQTLSFEYTRSADQQAASPARHPVVVVGAGPVGLSAAIDLAQQGIPVVLLDDDDTLSSGSRAICFAKRTLEIWDRLAVGEPMVAKGVGWGVGRVFLRDERIYSFDLLPETGHERPAFINLQQYYAEGYLVERAAQCSNLQIRWRNKVTGIVDLGPCVQLRIETPDGEYSVQADWLIACDGSRSPLRAMLGQESKGRVFRDRFLIADVKMDAEFPSERWFWFDPPFHPNQSALLHRQPDNVWRIDLQLGWDADPEAERKPERVIPRIRSMLGEHVSFELQWVSVYTFACMRMERFRHGRVLFAGDSAHGVSPFGARGANSGVQDVDNLAWKLRLVIQGLAPAELLDSYDSERVFAADENILNSTRATDFITPKSEVSRLFRDSVLKLARAHPFARRLVNSGRLSVPAVLYESVLNTADVDAFSGAMRPGTSAADAPVDVGGRSGWLLRHLGGEFTLLVFCESLASVFSPAQIRALSARPLALKTVLVTSPKLAVEVEGATVLQDHEGLASKRYDARDGTCYLLRPDQHVCARWRQFDPQRLAQALARATCNPSNAPI